MGKCQSKDANADAGTGAAAAAPAAGETGTGAKAKGAPPPQSRFKVQDHFVSAVDFLGVTAERTFVGLSKGMEDVKNKVMDDTAFKKRVDDAKEGVARLRVVFAAPLEFMEGYVAPVHAKTQEEVEFINESLGDSFLFEKLGERERRTLVDAFEKVSKAKGAEIIKQGDIGDYFYILHGGTVKFVVDGKGVGIAGRGDSFGELALLYNAPRAATCVAESDCELWRVDQLTFRRIIATYQIKGDEETKALLKKVEFLKGLDDNTLTKIVYCMSTKTYKAGEVIASKGDEVTHFYLVKEGKVKGMDITVGESKYNDIVVGPGEHFGDMAILKNMPTVGNIVAVEETTLLCLTKEVFVKLCGDYEHLMKKETDKVMLRAVPFASKPKLEGSVVDSLVSVIVNVRFKKNHVFFQEGDSITPALFLVRSGAVSVRSTDGTTKTIAVGGYFGEDTLDKEELEGKVTAKYTATATEDVVLGVLGYRAIVSVIGRKRKRADIKFDELQKYRILGAGTFGQVWLVSKKGTKEAYALKIQFKRQLIDSNQAAGVIREKNIMAKLDSDFIIKLVNTYQDDQNVYMLMKLYQGGELWSVMHGDDGDALPESAAKFYLASVLEGLTYMHCRHVLYRDLKPENVLLDSDGYTVIVDLGFAKHVPDKTYTFCGTPLYLAPEVILQRGHDKGADHWSWGVMLYEMICGITPFYDKDIDQMTLFKRIINQKYSFPHGDFVSKEAKDLIRSILVVNPVDRLGSFANAARDIEEHVWFTEIDFEKLQKKELTPPWKPDIKDPLDVSNFDNWDHLAEKKPEGHPLKAGEQKLFKDF